MNRLVRNKKIILGSTLPALNFDGSDFEKYKQARGLFIEDPWIRVKSIFLKDEYGALHPELVNAIRNSEIGACVGAVFGAFIESNKEVNKFMRTNDTNIFINKKEAYKRLNDKNILAMIKGGIKWAPCYAFFLGSFTLISSCFELYRNKISIIDNTVAGFSIGALCKFSYGIKGMISGGIIGGILGTLYGITFWSLCKMIKVDGIQIKYAHFAYLQHKEQKKNHALTPKNKLCESLEKSGMYSAHIPDPLNALNDEKEIQKFEEIKPN